ncbi:MAG: glycoside hydrolase family 16 protein [Pseudobdellovibrionaceae bacterium]
MKNKISYLSLILLVACSIETAEAALVKAEACPLVWSDEFNSAQSEPDPLKWYYHIGGNDVNSELQYYTSDRKNSRVVQDHLLIEAHVENRDKYEFTSARMITRQSFQYGYFEIRAKLPEGRGSWPAIWMLSEDYFEKGAPWPLCGEIDIMEHVGFDPNVIHASIHTEDFNWTKGTQKTEVVTIENSQTEYQVYGLDWQPSYLAVYINNKEIFRYTKPAIATKENWPFDQKFRLILNNAIGGFWGGMHGVDMSSFPQQFEIDYVRFFAKCKPSN